MRPIKTFRSVGLIVLLSALIALGLVLNLFVIPIPTIGVNLSFGWLPTMVLGWYFGPIIGFALGFTIDTLNFAIHGGVWFWLYAIQEPLLGMIAGIIGSVYSFAKNQSWKIHISILINQLFMFAFAIFSLAIVFIYTDPNNPAFIKLVQSGQLTYEVNTIFRYVILAVVIVFLGIIEIIIYIQYKKFKKHQNHQKFLTFLYSSIICIASTIIFSFVLGPVSAIKYYEYLNNRTPPNLLKYGAIYYLLPRVIKECIKTPIYVFLLLGVLYATYPSVKHIQTLARNTYKYDENIIKHNKLRLFLKKTNNKDLKNVKQNNKIDIINQKKKASQQAFNNLLKNPQRLKKYFEW